jgi:hypothetical protein
MTRQKQPILRRIGKAALVLVLLPLILPLALFAAANHLAYRALLYLFVWALWLPRGKDILFVYSDSPIWHEYMATHVLPLVQERAVILNWSERKKWSRWSLGVAVFHHLVLATLTRWLCCFGHFVWRECFDSGRRSRIGSEVIQNLWRDSAKNCLPAFSGTG